MINIVCGIFYLIRKKGKSSCRHETNETFQIILDFVKLIHLYYGIKLKTEVHFQLRKENSIRNFHVRQRHNTLN